MLSYLKAYESLPVETATQLLSNDLLLEPLHPAEDEQFHQYLESIVQEQKATISLEEKVAVERQLERELAEKEALEKRLTQERAERAKEKVRADKEKARADKAEQLLRRKEKELTIPPKYLERGNGQSQNDISSERQAREEAQSRAKEDAFARENAERKAENYITLTAITVGIILVGVFEFTTNYLLKWFPSHWAGLQLAINALLILITVGVFHPKWRKWCWGGGAFAILLVIIQLVGSG